MTRDRLVLLLIVAAAGILVAGLALVLWVAANRDAATAPAASPTRFAILTPSASSTPTPTPSPSITAVVATCQTTTTDAFRAEMAARGWTAAIVAEGAGPYDRFFHGAPTGQVRCRWSAAPAAAAAEQIELAWAAIDPENAVAAMTQLEGEGYAVSDAVEGRYLVGPGDCYLFTPDDVRWAASRTQLAAVAAPH